MNEQIKLQILNKIKEYDKIIVSRHIRPDGDAVGSTQGLVTVLKKTFPTKTIKLINEDYSDYVGFLGTEDSQEEDDYYRDALGIVIDTATIERCSNKKITLSKELIKIDHHVDILPYGDLSWVEDERSAACEMIADFLMTFKNELVIDSDAALPLYAGMCTDSGRFKYGLSGETFRCAGFLVDFGIDTETLYARLYLDDFDIYKFHAYAYEQMKITENGVAYIYVDKAMQEKFNLSREEASNVISLLSEIKGCIAWIAFIDNVGENNDIRVRLRSRFMTINKLGEKYRGGGHEKAAGATCENVAEMEQLIKDADALVKEYKESHDGWM